MGSDGNCRNRIPKHYDPIFRSDLTGTATVGLLTTVQEGHSAEAVHSGGHNF